MFFHWVNCNKFIIKCKCFIDLFEMFWRCMKIIWSVETVFSISASNLSIIFTICACFQHFHFYNHLLWITNICVLATEYKTTVSYSQAKTASQLASQPEIATTATTVQHFHFNLSIFVKLNTILYMGMNVISLILGLS